MKRRDLFKWTGAAVGATVGEKVASKLPKEVTVPVETTPLEGVPYFRATCTPSPVLVSAGIFDCDHEVLVSSCPGCAEDFALIMATADAEEWFA